jgi:hypothetical protein
MRTVSFRNVLEDVLGIAGYPYDSANQGQLDMAARFINRYVRTFWEWGPWPEWTRAEWRPFANYWYANLTYGPGEVVYWSDTDKYYTCTAITTAGIQPDDTDYFEELTTRDAHLAREQYYQNKIGRMWGVTKRNPYLYGRGENYTFGFFETTLGFMVPDCKDNRVWALFSDFAPVFAAKPWDAAYATNPGYASGDLVFYPGTEADHVFPRRGWVYRADYDQNQIQVWIPVDFPQVAQDYVVNKAAADMLRHYNRAELAAGYDQRGDAAILDEWDKVNTKAFQAVWAPQ